MGRQALHAFALEFDHPLEGRRMRFEAAVPPDFERTLAAFELTPAGLLDAKYASWDALLLAAADDVAATGRKGGPLAKYTWGERNRLSMKHPFSRFLPQWVAKWLNMEPVPQAGDVDMPHVAGPVHGQSERLVVSPGHEDQAIFHMPGGQSGNPLSPFYRAGHEAWVKGEPTPLLPGPTQHTLVLKPR